VLPPFSLPSEYNATPVTAVTPPAAAAIVPEVIPPITVSLVTTAHKDATTAMLFASV
jgi:hypothetical protein